MDYERQQHAPIYEALERFRKKRVVPFDVPGHKRGRGNPELAQLLGEKCVGLDVNSMKPLDKLAKDGTVIKYVAEKGCQAAYQYVEPGRGCEQHLHLKCVKCGKIIHLECHFMEEISHHIEESHGFTLQCKNSILYGVCKECKGSGEDC